MQIKISILFMTLAVLLTSCYRQVQYYPVQEPYQDYCHHDVVDETYVHKYGVTVPENDWEARGQHGKVISTLKNGVVVTKNYQSGILEGDTTYTFPHSEALDCIETYSKGKVARVVHHYRSGLPRERVEFLPSHCQTTTTWYENGAAKSVEEYAGQSLVEGEYYTSHNQVESRIDNGSGHRVQRDEYGQLLSLDTFNEGKLVQMETYHPNGTPKEIVCYLSGEMHGQRKTFTPAGEPIAIEHWSHGNQHGLTTYFENGEMIAEVPYAYGTKDGVERRFRNGEEVVEEIEWSNDLKHGISQNYFGSTAITEYYFQGKKVSKLNYDQMNQWQLHG